MLAESICVVRSGPEPGPIPATFPLSLLHFRVSMSPSISLSLYFSPSIFPPFKNPFAFCLESLFASLPIPPVSLPQPPPFLVLALSTFLS